MLKVSKIILIYLLDWEYMKNKPETELEAILANLDREYCSLPYKEIKKIKLEKIIKYTLYDSSYRDEIKILFNRLNIKDSQIIDHFLVYNLDLKAYYAEETGNVLYQSLLERVVSYMHKLIPNSWHEEGQRVLMECIDRMAPSTVVDIGFGVPTLYVKEALQKEIPHITLLDLYEPAFTFAKEVLNIWDKNWTKTVSFKKADMEDFAFIGNYDFYIFQEAIERVSDPVRYLTRQLNDSPLHAKFYFLVPICPLIPAHSIAWETNEEAIKWFEQFDLKIIDVKPIHVNPKIDLFANDPGLKINFLQLLCGK